MKDDADDGDRQSGMLDTRHKMTLSPVISLAAAIIIHLLTLTSVSGNLLLLLTVFASLFS